MATADDLILDVRQRLVDSDDESYTDAILLQFLSDGQRLLSKTAGVCQTTHEFTTDAGDADEDLATMTLSEWVAIYRVEDNGTTLDYAPPYEAKYWGTAAAGTATAWTVWADTFTTDAIIAASRTLKLWYTYVPADLTATSNTVYVPVKWQSAMVSYAVYRCREQDREGGLGDRAWNEFDLERQAAAAVNAAVLMNGGYAKRGQ